MHISSTSPLSSPWLPGNTSGVNTTLSAGAALPSVQQTQLTLRETPASGTTLAHVTQIPAILANEDLTYEALKNIRLTAGQMQAWEQASDDTVSQAMARNAGGMTTASRLSGLGSALLEQIGSGATHYRQTVANTSAPSSRQQIQARASDAINGLQSLPSARLELRVQTQTGATVTLRLVDQNERGANATGIMAELQVDGTLSDAERKAVQALASGFERAMQGLVNGETQVDLEKLTQFDNTLIARLDLSAQVYGRDNYGGRIQKLGASVRADANTREIKLSRPEGDVNMSIDLRQPAFWGSAAQKNKAVDKYLARMDQAATRGHADRELVQLFKSTFASLTATYGAQATSSSDTRAGALDEEDASWLTGLADFKAQLTATPKASNPRKPMEKDRFQYTVDQTTVALGSAASSRTVTQTQNAKLSAAYHQSLFSSGVPSLDSSTASQNYYYKQVEDSSSTEVRLQYDKNALVAASMTQLVEQSLRTQKFEYNKRTEDRTEITSLPPKVTDLLPEIKQLKDRDARHLISADEKRELLADWNDRLFA